MTRFLYRLTVREHGIWVDLGTYDPNRWPGSPNSGGISFGEHAEVHVSESWKSDVERGMTARVSMAAIGSHDTGTGRRRIGVYEQACQIADFVSEMLDRGVALEAIGRKLEATLATDPANPADEPFDAEKARNA